MVPSLRGYDPKDRPGRHRVVLVIDGEPAARRAHEEFGFPVHQVGAWPEGRSLRREDVRDEAIPTAGRRVHDATIVAAMVVYGIRRLLTANPSDFARLAHLLTAEPMETGT